MCKLLYVEMISEILLIKVNVELNLIISTNYYLFQRFRMIKITKTFEIREFKIKLLFNCLISKKFLRFRNFE